MGRRRGSRGSLEGLWVTAAKAVEYMYTKCLFDQVDIGPYHRGRRRLSEPQSSLESDSGSWGSANNDVF